MCRIAAGVLPLGVARQIISQSICKVGISREWIYLGTFELTSVVRKYVVQIIRFLIEMDKSEESDKIIAATPCNYTKVNNIFIPLTENVVKYRKQIINFRCCDILYNVN
jgi:hypothetical protein